MKTDKWLESIRSEFPALTNRKNGKPPIYFDNACTTLVPKQVIEAIEEYYGRFPGCGGKRSRYWFAREVESRIEGNPEQGIQGTRQIVQEFINARSEKEIIFTLNTSHALNQVALGYKFQPGDVVLLTDKEHNSNLAPWLRLQKQGKVKVDIVASRPDDTIDLDDLQQKLVSRKVRLLAMAYTSNLTGYTIPAREIIKMAHDHGALVLLDAAQSAPHMAIDVQHLDVDFLAFSIHKMCGPRGVGILYGKQDLLGKEPHEEDDLACAIEPFILGGGTLGDTTYDKYFLLEPPERFEAGIQNYPGQIATAAAIRFLQRIGMPEINAIEKRLNSYLTEQILEQYGDTGWFQILGPQDPAQRGGILTFEVKRPNAVGLAEELNSRNNIMIRDGVFCVHAYLNKIFGPDWTRPRLPGEHRMTYRVSLYFYNTLEECRVFLDTLHDIFKERSYI
ncbi:MAG: aminotransferase class V-fold PLP-dependent enzyme [Dehalococcoidales bacterium]|nr:aminotransferase class V-fold PLP-dependent enzyme [Dehalococcoidales bacterium]